MLYFGGYDNHLVAEADGVNENITWGNNFNFDYSDSFTICCSVYALAATNQLYLAKVNNPLSSTGWGCGFNSQGRPEFFFNHGGGALDVTTGTPNGALSTWFHHTFVWDGSGGSPYGASNLTIYRQGIAATNSVVTDTVGAGGTTSNAVNLTMFSGSSGAAPLNGRLCNVSIWSAAMTSAQVSELWNGGIPFDLTSHTLASSLAFWWRGGEDDNFTTARDVVGNLAGTYNNMEVGDIAATAPESI